ATPPPTTPPANPATTKTGRILGRLVTVASRTAESRPRATASRGPGPGSATSDTHRFPPTPGDGRRPTTDRRCPALRRPPPTRSAAEAATRPSPGTAGGPPRRARRRAVDRRWSRR